MQNSLFGNISISIGGDNNINTRFSQKSHQYVILFITNRYNNCKLMDILFQEIDFLKGM